MKLPEADFDLESPDAFAVLAGIFTLHIGAEMSFAREPSVLWGIASVYVFGAALLLVGAGVTSVDVREWGRPLAGLAFIALLVGITMTYLMIHGSTIKTDALAFINDAANGLLAGRSPYELTMTSGDAFPTPTLQGGKITTYSYPLGSALATAPFALLVEDGARLAVLTSTVVGGSILLWYSPHDLAPLALLSLLIGDFIAWGVNDLTDPLWVAPLLATMVVWPWSKIGPDRLSWSGVLFGIAMAMKQQPWFCAPFLFIWVWKERSLRSAVGFATITAAVFWLINLPSLVLAPVATMQGLFINLWGLEGTLVHLGVGLSALTLSGAYPIAKGAHTTLMAGVGLSMVAAYWLRFDQLKWLAWIAWAPILFFNYRSLGNYFIVVAPVAVMILICQRGREPTEVRHSASAGAA